MPFFVRADDKRPMVHTPFWSFPITPPPEPLPPPDFSDVMRNHEERVAARKRGGVTLTDGGGI